MREDLLSYIRNRVSAGKDQNFFLENDDADKLIDDEINQLSNLDLLDYIDAFLMERKI